MRVVFYVIFVISSVRGENVPEIVNSEVQSTFDLTSSLVTESNVIIFINNGPGPVRSYIYVVSEPEDCFLSFANEKGAVLTYEKEEKLQGFRTYKVLLPFDLEEDHFFKLHVMARFAFKAVPVYETKLIDEDQVVRFNANYKFFSPYETQDFNRRIVVDNNSVLETSTPVDYNLQHLEPMSYEPMEIVYVNNLPFLTVTRLERIIYVSHYGRIYIEDTVSFKNNGSKLMGPFKDGLSPNYVAKAATNWLYTHLPASAQDTKLFDPLGYNFQTYVLNFHDYLTLKFKNRYPVYGGWRSTYTLQYYIPVHEYLFHESDNYVLKIRGIDHVFNDVIIEEAKVKIVLPEGALIDFFRAPKSLVLEREEPTYLGGLCLMGRPSVILNGTILFDNHIAPVLVKYYYNSVFLLGVPLVIAAFLQCTFLLFLISRHLSKK